MIAGGLRPANLAGQLRIRAELPIDHELDLAAFHARYKNDTEGAPAYDLAVLLKIILLAYSRSNKRPDRFTLRGRKKVDGQWKLYCLVHTIEKLAHHGYAG